MSTRSLPQPDLASALQNFKNSPLSPAKAWLGVKAQLRSEMDFQYFRRYMARLELLGYDHSRDELLLRAPNESCRRWAEMHLKPTLCRLVSLYANRKVTITILS